jgi:hypothetical protein
MQTAGASKEGFVSSNMLRFRHEGGEELSAFEVPAVQST